MCGDPRRTPRRTPTALTKVVRCPSACRSACTATRGMRILYSPSTAATSCRRSIRTLRWRPGPALTPAPSLSPSLPHPNPTLSLLRSSSDSWFWLTEMLASLPAFSSRTPRVRNLATSSETKMEAKTNEREACDHVTLYSCNPTSSSDILNISAFLIPSTGYYEFKGLVGVKKGEFMYKDAKQMDFWVKFLPIFPFPLIVSGCC